MLSLSKNEVNVISFLIRNFSKKYTIRNVAAKLGVSAAGMHASLKKLEKSSIVKVEKLGSGMFYEVNLNNKVAKHLAAAVLLDHFDVKKINVEEIEKEGRAAVFDGKKLLVITVNPDVVKDICYRQGIDVICKTEDDFLEDTKILEKGNVLFGEDVIIEAIRKVMR